MTGWDLIPWIGWVLTVGAWVYRALPKPPPRPLPPTPITDGWHQVIMNAQGEAESIRRVRDGSAPTRIERGHGRTATWYRLTHVDGLSLIYKPEPPQK